MTEVIVNPIKNFEFKRSHWIESFMRARTQPRYDPQTRCAQTWRLRHRAREAEARADAAEAAVAEVRGEMEQLRRAIRHERSEALAVMESPGWYCDLLRLARDRVRAELIALSIRRDSCPECGSFGRGFQAGFLQAEIDALTQAHDLPPVDALAPIDWPVHMGRRILKGRALDRRWLQPVPRRVPARRVEPWGQS